MPGMGYKCAKVLILLAQSQLVAVLLSGGHLAMTVDIFICHNLGEGE